jgi:hypothetical protein
MTFLFGNWSALIILKIVRKTADMDIGAFGSWLLFSFFLLIVWDTG